MTVQQRTPITDGIHSLCSASVVVLEQPAEALAADNIARSLADRIIRLNDLVFEPLMISLRMKMGHEMEAQL